MNLPPYPTPSLQVEPHDPNQPQPPSFQIALGTLPITSPAPLRLWAEPDGQGLHRGPHKFWQRQAARRIQCGTWWL